MQIQAINSVSFNGIEKKTDKQQNNIVSKKFNEGAAYYSKTKLNEAQRLSVGRETEDGDYKITSALAGAGAVAAMITAFSKSIKSLNLHKKLNKAIKNSASSERIAELKTAALKKQKGSAITLGVGLALAFVSIGAWAKNLFEANKTANERGFVSNEELNQKENNDKSIVDEALKDIKTEETAENNITDEIKKPAQ